MRLVNTLALLVSAGTLAAQDAAEWKDVLSRLEKLEHENQELREEIRSLRAEMGARTAQDGVVPAKGAGIEERLAIQEARTEEQQQVKVGASQRFPIRITGMALFNLFANGANSWGIDQPVFAWRFPEQRKWGGTLRQSVLGLEYDGPGTVWGGKVRGSLFMDFFGGSGQSLDSLLRVRTGEIRVDWKNRSVMAGQEKPLFAPRNPTSYAQVGVSPLTAAGNLWRWQPQVRFEQRLPLGRSTGLRAQIGFIQTSEDHSALRPGGSYWNAYLGNTLPNEYRRPGVEGRFEFWHRMDDTRRVEVAPGFHFSRSQLAGHSLPSNLFSMDWFLNPWQRLEVSGAFFSGVNVGHFGAPHPGYTLTRTGRLIPVHSRGGWAQFAFLATNRLTFNIYGGEHDDRNTDLLAGDIGLNREAAANLLYRLAPNVVLSLEASQLRTTYLGSVGRRINNHYDLAVAYLF